MKFISFILFLITPLMAASAPNWHADSFEPAFAADQQVVTTNVLEYEAAQFKNLGQLRSFEASLSTKELAREEAQKHWDRMKTLFSKGQATQTQVDEAQISFIQSESHVARVRSQMERARMSTEIQKLRVLESGSVKGDYRLKIAQFMKESFERDRESAVSALASAQSNLEYFREHLKKGECLLEKKVITRVEYDRRRTYHQEATESVISWESQLKSIDLSILGLGKSIARLRSGLP